MYKRTRQVRGVGQRPEVPPRVGMGRDDRTRRGDILHRIRTHPTVRRALTRHVPPGRGGPGRDGGGRRAVRVHGRDRGVVPRDARVRVRSDEGRGAVRVELGARRRYRREPQARGRAGRQDERLHRSSHQGPSVVSEKE